ncbi:MAG TPA: ABC transporter ATP-binding protein [Anaerolineae bacterium]|nr:ABC transporter ATP-binding protein [Anaerolineae bacterium]
MTAAIEVKDLRKNYNHLEAVKGISFEVGAGEVFGFLGHNGAGKTTTIKMLTGQLTPTGGSGCVGGFDIVRQRQHIKSIIGVVFEEQNLYERMNGRDNLLFFARLYGVAGRRADELLDLVGLKARAKDPIKKYSNGMKQRLLVARALLHQPQVLFLDEPTRGLDPTAAHDIRQVVADLARQGATVFLTTHYMEEADQLCHRVAFISEGLLIALDTPRELKLRYGCRAARVLLDDRSEHVLSLTEPAEAARLGEWAAAGRVLSVHSQEATLEEVFRHLAGREL